MDDESEQRLTARPDSGAAGGLQDAGALEALDPILSEVDGGQVTPSEAIEQLLDAPYPVPEQPAFAGRHAVESTSGSEDARRFRLLLSALGKARAIESLHELGFIARKENVIFLGPPGVGKTHVASSLAIAAAEHGRRVYYGTWPI